MRLSGFILKEKKQYTIIIILYRTLSQGQNLLYRTQAVLDGSQMSNDIWFINQMWFDIIERTTSFLSAEVTDQHPALQ